MRHHLKCNEVTPFGALQSLKHVIQHYAQTTMGLPRVHWTTENCDRVQLDSHIVRMEDIQSMVADLLKETKDLIFNKVLMGVSLEDIGYDFGPDTPVVDALPRTSPGYSFLNDPLNPFLAMDSLLAKAFLSHPKVKGYFHTGIDSEGAPIWNRAHIATWMRHVERATENIGLLMFLLGGQPPRGTEFCLIKLQNLLTRLRNIFWLDNNLMFVLFYSKVGSISQRDRVIVHGLPWEVTELFMIMQVLVRPLTVDWTYALYGEARARVQDQSLLASEGVAISSDRFSHLLEQLTQRATGCPMGFARWRHLAIAIMRQHLMVIEADEEGQTANSVYDMQAAHTTGLANMLYAIKTSEWHLMSSTAVAKFLNASRKTQLWMLKKFHEGGDDSQEPSSPSLQLPLEPSLASTSSESPPAPACVQANLDLQALNNMEARMVAKFQGIMDAGFEKLLSITQPAKTHIVPSHIQLVPPHPFHLQMLRNFLQNPTAQFLSESQGTALATAATRRAHLLAVLPTNAGKSMLFMAPASMEPMVTVVVVPLLALKFDLMRRAQAAGLECNDWHAGLVQDHGLVLISAETAGLDTFQHWARLQFNQGKLARVCIDEVHLLLTSIHFRPRLGELSWLGTLGAPLLLSTATLPPDLQPHLQQAVGIHTMAVVRSSTQRPELQFHMVQYAPGREVQAAEYHARQYSKQLQPYEVILLQCRDKETAIEVAARLSCPVFHADLDDATKRQVLNGWLSGEYQCITATSALGVGVHHPHCLAVLHVGVPYGVIELSQEGGRAGRDGHTSLCIVFWSKPLPQAQPSAVDFSGYDALKQMLQDGRGCRRLALSSHLDGPHLKRSCCALPGAMCDNCQKELQCLQSQTTPLWRIRERADTVAPVCSNTDSLVVDLPPRLRSTPSQSTGGAHQSRTLPGIARVNVQADWQSHPSCDNSPQYVLPGQPPRTPSSSTPSRRAASISPSTSKQAGSSRGTQGVLSPPDLPSQTSVNLDPAYHSGFTVEKLKSAMQALRNRCIVCHFEGLPDAHTIDNCQESRAQGPVCALNHLGEGASLMQTKAQTRSIPHGAACYTCWYPAGDWHPKLMRNQITCDSPDQLPQLAWLIYHTRRAFTPFTSYFNLQFQDAAAMFRWCQSQSARNPKFINMHVVLVWYLEKLKGMML